MGARERERMLANAADARRLERAGRRHARFAPSACVKTHTANHWAKQLESGREFRFEPQVRNPRHRSTQYSQAMAGMQSVKNALFARSRPHPRSS